MIEARNEREWVVRLQDGEDVIQALRALNADSALILEGIGMVRGATLGYWNGTSYEEHPHAAPAELVCLQGNLAVGEGGERIVHAHATLAERDGTVSGGHLLQATVHNTLELGLLPLDGIALERHPEPGGLMGLVPRAT
jgi:uncharacterized protein